MSANFDTYAIVQKLKATGLSEDKAVIMVEAIKDAQSNLVTQDSLKVALVELENRMLLKVFGMMLGQTALIVALIKLL